MKCHWAVAASLLVSLAAGPAWGAESALPPGQKEPVLRIEGNGPTSSVTAMTFSPDGKTLYAAGYDKVVRVFTYDPVSGQFERQRTTYRVMIGPGLVGAINALALSPKGDWLAVGGWGLVRGGTDFRSAGFVLPQIGAWDERMLRDVGLIYAFNTTPHGNKPPVVRLLRGHRGQVLAMTYVAGAQGKSLLVSAARERDADNKYQGVVRLWDVDAGVNLATLTHGLPNHNKQLGLAAWSTGKGPKQVRVAIAWDDGSLRIWDADRGDVKPQIIPFGAYSNSNLLAYLPGSNPAKIFTASFQKPNGRSTQYHGLLQEWKTTDGGADLAAGQYKLFPPTRNPSGNSSFYVPVALVPFSGQGNGKVDYAALIQRIITKGKADQYVIQLVSLLSGDAFGTLEQEFLTESPGESPPVLAAVPSGKFLALAAGKGHSIKLLNLPDLLQKRVKKQTIQSGAAAVQVVSFATKGKAQGLRLRDISAERAKPVDLVFDFSNRNLTSDLADWQSASPDRQGWTVTRTADGETSQKLVVSKGGDEVGRPIRLKANQLVTTYAVLPPMKPLNKPLLVVGYLDYESGEAILAVFNVATGERVRQLAGHVDAVRSVAFSADGRLLASAGDDQTVCIWTLTDLGRILGKRGMIPELFIVKAEAGVRVKEVRAGSPAAGKLAADDLIEGIVLGGGRFQALDSPRKFYEAMWQQEPGTMVTLRVKNKGAVQVQVGQGIDERNPLFSLFVTRPDDQGEQGWIGWSPFGYYDFSDRAAERFLLWHFNKGKTDEPTTTAPITEFRKEYQRQDLLRFLVTRGNLAAALRDWDALQARRNRPRPTMILTVNETGQGPPAQDGQGRFVVRSPKVTLNLSIPELPRDVQGVVEWQFEDGPWQKFVRQAGTEWSTPLAAQDWKRGSNRVRVVLHTDGDGQQKYTEELALNYRPLPPRIRYEGPARQIVHEPKFILKARVQPGSPDEPVVVTLSQKHDGEEVLAPAQRTVGLDIEKTLTLKPGLNLVQIVARNKKAPADAELETTPRTVEIILTKKDDPPLITLNVQTLPQGNKQKVAAGQVIVVDAPRLRFSGEIAAQGKLTRAEWSPLGKPSRKLTDFVSGSAKWPVAEELVLEPSRAPKEVRFIAKTDSSETAEVRVRVVYRPPVPRFKRTAPADETVLYDDADQPEVPVAGRFDWPADFQPCKVEILVNGRSVKTRAIARKVDTFTDKVAVGPGDNQIQVRLTNAWDAMATSEGVVVSYLRRPRVKILVANPPLRIKDRPLVDLDAEVTSPVPLKSVQAEVSGSEGPRPIKVELTGPGRGNQAQVWKVRLVDVTLDPGNNTVRVSAANQEASTRKPATVVVHYTEPPRPPPPPDVILVSPTKDTTAVKADLVFRARIKSEKPLTRVELVREGRFAKCVPVNVAGLKLNPLGYYEVSVPIKLVPEDNRLRLEVVNRGGAGPSQPVVVTYFPQRPVRVEILHLQVKGNARKFTSRKDSTANTLHFDELPGNRVVVTGQVTWDPESDELLKKEYPVIFYVNGLRQLPVDLEPAEGGQRVRTFSAQVSLTRKTNNRIQVELSDELKRSTDNVPVCVVDCAHPVLKQRVYLLPISVGEEDEDALMKRLYQALQADLRNMEPRRFKTPVFFEGRLYGPLTGYVEKREVLTLLNRIKEEIKYRKTRDLNNTDDAPVDVLMLYYRGSDAIDSGNYELKTSDRRVAIKRDELLKQFQETLGAQIVFLDVARAQNDSPVVHNRTRPDRFPEDARVTVFRYTWPSNAAQKEPPLIQALTAALRQGGKLAEVAMAVKEQYDKMARERFYEYYPKELADLLLARESSQDR